MKTSRAIFAAVMLGLTLGAVSLPASAQRYYHHGYYGGPRVAFGFYGGPGWWGPGYWGPGYWGPGYGYGYGYPYGYGYAPPVVVVPSEPRVYVEPNAPAAQAAPAQWWYWCPSANGYYPYVSTCSEGWQRVAPQPPQGPQ
jgi:hypothetical protein